MDCLTPTKASHFSKKRSFKKEFQFGIELHHKNYSKKNLRSEPVDTLDTVSDRFPTLFSHQGAVAQLNMGQGEAFPIDYVFFAYNKFVLSFTFSIKRNRLSAVMH